MKIQFNKMSKSILSGLLAMVMLFALLPVMPVSAEEVVQIGVDEKAAVNHRELSVPAGQTVTVETVGASKFVLTIHADDLKITYNGLEYYSADGQVSLLVRGGQYENMDITNLSSEDQELTLEFTRFSGHKNNPVVLGWMGDVTIHQMVEYEFGMDTGTYLTWKAPSGGKLELDVTDVESETEGMTAKIIVNEKNESEDGVLAVRVSKDEEISIRVVALSPYGLPMNATIHLKAKFGGKQDTTGTLPEISPVPANLTTPKDPDAAEPTEPEVTEPQPTEPQPTEPQPTEPQPTEPQPTEPQPTEPQPTEPQPTEPTEPSKPSNPFTDVVAGKYYYDAVLWAVDKEITNGITPTTFVPGGECTRGQVVTFLWRAAGCPEPTITKCPFTDVKESAFYYDAMLWAVEKGITTGMSDTTFEPNGKCTRGQVVTFIWRAAGSPVAGSGKCAFTDVKENAYYYKAMLWAVEKGITTGMSDTTFVPGGNCQRGQVVTFLWRFYA